MRTIKKQKKCNGCIHFINDPFLYGWVCSKSNKYIISNKGYDEKGSVINRPDFCEFSEDKLLKDFLTKYPYTEQEILDLIDKINVLERVNSIFNLKMETESIIENAMRYNISLSESINLKYPPVATSFTMS